MPAQSALTSTKSGELPTRQGRTGSTGSARAPPRRLDRNPAHRLQLRTICSTAHRQPETHRSTLSPVVSLRRGGRQPHMSPPTSEDTPHLGAGSRYRPTPAADGQSDRPPPAATPRAQESLWPPAPDPGDRPQSHPPTHPATGLRRFVSERAALAARGVHRPRGRSDTADWAQPALPSRRPRGAGRDPHRPQHPQPQTRPAGPARLHRPADSQPR
jgi:hypothetical protein